jgi:sirohydrochlorin ferrochelatase
MERRQGPEYDFNGQLLGDLLDSCVSGGRRAAVVLAMMFISPGRHAGAGGDIETICAEAMARNPRLRVKVSPLVGEHPLLVEILKDRLEAALRETP